MSQPRHTLVFAVLLSSSFLLLHGRQAQAQSFGVEMLNNIMPASGAMAGTSNAAPQDVQSAIYGNPATLTQMRGTNFSFSGAWIEPTYNITQAVPLAAFGVGPYSAKSDAQGIAAGNIGITQDFSALGMPVTVGMGLFAGAGAGVDFRQVPASNGTHASIVALDTVMSAAIDVTDKFTFGASATLSTMTLDGPFVGISGSSTDYAPMLKLGGNYQVSPNMAIGAYWRSKAQYTFENLISFGGPFFNVALDRPEVVGMGISNNRLMDGRLLLAIDVTYLEYADADFLKALYNDQWAFQFGAQFTPNCGTKIRLGYAYNQNPMRDIPATAAGGVAPPGGLAHIQYIQAQFAAIPQHRITGGIGIQDVLPGVDVDLFAGGMFRNTQTFGTTTASLTGYWIGFATTWHFGRGACEYGDWGYE